MAEMLAEDMLAKLEFGRCPDCGSGGNVSAFIAGPRGGMGQNIACRWCGSEFNAAKIGGFVALAHRNSEPGKPDHNRLKDVFGIVLSAPEAT
jgi:hypothetical protein